MARIRRRRKTRGVRSAADVYSKLADLWPAHDRERAEAIRLAAARVVRALRSGGSVLDVGCGTGAHLAAVRAEARRRGKRLGALVGLELAPAMVARAARRRGVRAVAGDALALPFVDHAFDVVFASDLVHLVEDPVRLAREMVRVARPGGTIIVELAEPHPQAHLLRRLAASLPPTSLLRAWLELPRRYGASPFRAALQRARCQVREVSGRGLSYPDTVALRLLRRMRPSPPLARELAAAGGGRLRYRVLVARLPGPRTGRMPITVTGLAGWTPRRVQRLLADLPPARGYELCVKPLRYRTRPHVQAFCEFDRRRIIVQVPVPFRPFSEAVPYRAQQVGAKGHFRFRWYRRLLRFDRPHELIRYLYLHEYYHWYLREALDRASGAETACDRFALQRVQRGPVRPPAGR